MRKKGARRTAAMPSYLLLPEQVARYITPLRMSLELLPLGLFSKDHANHVAMCINLVAVDSAGKGNGMWQIADEAGTVLTAMYERHKAGKAWNCTADERKTLMGCINKFDRYMRGWTSARLIAAAATVVEIDEREKAKGGKFLDRVEITEVA